MNFCEGGDLYTKLKAQDKDGKALKETQVVEWFVQITMALQVCIAGCLKANFSDCREFDTFERNGGQKDVK